MRFDYDKFMSQQVDTIRDLVHLDYGINDDCEEALQIARQNAPTLQSLVIYFSSVKDISSLIQGTGGSYVEYPHLRTLGLCNDVSLGMSYDLESTLPHRSKRDTVRLPVFAGAIPFPGLRCLRVKMDYPFGDDTLFRGNAATLEYVDFQLFPAFIDRVCKYKVFTPDSHPKLRYVRKY
ncbi:hypothetical protein GGI17_006490 [Coemansia sp. S146]|nr:hypothetical protein GGI17_006490 [Coemansia sp. S146]